MRSHRLHASSLGMPFRLCNALDVGPKDLINLQVRHSVERVLKQVQWYDGSPIKVWLSKFEYSWGEKLFEIKFELHDSVFYNLDWRAEIFTGLCFVEPLMTTGLLQILARTNATRTWSKWGQNTLHIITMTKSYISHQVRVDSAVQWHWGMYRELVSQSCFAKIHTIVL